MLPSSYHSIQVAVFLSSWIHGATNSCRAHHVLRSRVIPPLPRNCLFSAGLFGAPELWSTDQRGAEEGTQKILRIPNQLVLVIFVYIRTICIFMLGRKSISKDQLSSVSASV